MKLLFLVLGTTTFLVLAACSVNKTGTLANTTHPAKDMYVIHATVYEVGILTNKTGNGTDNVNSTGHQESVTLFHSNGSKLDLGAIPEPFLTNVSAQTLVGVAPVSSPGANNSMHVLDALGQFTHPASLPGDGMKSVQKRSLDNFIQRLFKRDVQGSTPVKVVNGTAMIPPEAGIQSVSLLPLLSLNNKMSEIPVPIPNTSVVHYAKVDTLIKKP